MPTFPDGTRFHGYNLLPDLDAGMSVAFQVGRDYTGPLPSGVTQVTPLMIANAINEVLVDNGWSPIEFFGAPVDEPLNPPTP